MTGLEVITRALRLIGVTSTGDPISSDDAADALQALRGMVDGFATQRLTIYSTNRTLFPLVSGQQTYTLGPGGNFNVPRPLWLQLGGIVFTNISPAAEIAFERPPLTDAQWGAIVVKSLTGACPVEWYLDGSFPLTNLSVWPIPNVGYLQIALYLPTAITGLSDLTTDTTFPPQYAEMLVYQLAIRLANDYQRQPSPGVVALAAEFLGNVKRANIEPIDLRCDDAVVRRPSSSRWNILVGP